MTEKKQELEKLLKITFREFRAAGKRKEKADKNYEFWRKRLDELNEDQVEILKKK